jgi:hypothetical protein
MRPPVEFLAEGLLTVAYMASTRIPEPKNRVASGPASLV